jgi:DNA-binding transcriptional regulator GbsR (MarR family)
MGTRWGINRTVAQIHALLYLSSTPVHAEDIAKTLAVARSNVSTSLRELQGWGIVKVVHVLGDRRDHFEAMTDVWEMFRIILEERKRREIDPTLAMLRSCVAEVGKGGDEYTRQRLAAMLEFMETITGYYDEIQNLPAGTLPHLIRLRGKVKKLLTFPAAG